MEVLPTGSLSIEAVLSLPEKHYLTYRPSFQNLVLNTTPNTPEHRNLIDAGKVWDDNCDQVDAKIEAERSKIELLLLQQSCKFSCSVVYAIKFYDISICVCNSYVP